MELLCTRPTCPKPVNDFPELDDARTLKLTRDKFCRCCGMPLILGDRYLPVQLLGQGGFGAAYLARDRHTPGMRPCVVKQFKPAVPLTHHQHQLAHELFMREGEVLEELGREHLQIPDLFAFFDLEVPGMIPGSEEAYFYLAQEFIDGRDLEQELRSVGHLDEAAVREILVSMLTVLGFVHAHQTIHRDIKPSNIMRSRKGRLYLLDFGAIKYATAQASRPQTSTSIFSLGYAPPEQMAGAGVSFSTDLYALAATCVECLTGLDPSQLCDPVTRVYSWRDQAIVSDRLAAILDKMLQPTPYDRFATAADVLTELCPDAVIPHPFQPPISTDFPRPTPINANVITQMPQMPLEAPVTQLPISPQAVSLQPRSKRQPFSMVELVSSAAFTGFEGALLAIGLHGLGMPILVKALLGVGLAAVLIYCQTNRTIERLDLPIIAGITLSILVLVLKVGFVSSMMVAIAIALMTTLAVLLFRLVYTLLA
jgi:serine/threonine protein kinase